MSIRRYLLLAICALTLLATKASAGDAADESAQEFKWDSANLEAHNIKEVTAQLYDTEIDQFNNNTTPWVIFFTRYALTSKPGSTLHSRNSKLYPDMLKL